MPEIKKLNVDGDYGAGAPQKLRVLANKINEVIDQLEQVKKKHGDPTN